MRISLAVGLLVLFAGCAEDPAPPAPTPLPPLGGAPAKPQGNVEERIKAADEAFAKKDYRAAVDNLEEAVLLDNKNRQVLLRLVRYAQARSLAARKEKTPEAYNEIRKAGLYLRKLRDEFPDATEEEKALTLEVLYNEATLHALSKRVEETTGSIRDMVGYGFKDFDRIEKDPDWADMRAIPQFQAEWEKIKGKK